MPGMEENPTAVRGEGTRVALVAAATRVFAHYGYDGASSRALAAEAGVNQALISYHFGGKRGLYLAVFERIAATISERIGPALADVRRGLDAAPGDRRRAVDALVILLNALVDLFLSADLADWAKLILREQQEPTEAFDLLYDGPMSRMLATVTQLVGTAAGDDADTDARVTALTLVGQAMVFRAAHAAAARHLGWKASAGAADIDTIKQQIARNLRARFA